MGRRARLWLAVIAGAIALRASTPIAHAQEATAVLARTFDLRWSAPAECPSDTYVATQVTRLTSRTPEPRLEVDGKAWRDESGRWRVALVTRFGDDRGERIVDADTCDHAADATALIVAMMIDPAGVRARLDTETKAVSSEPPSPPPADALAAQPPRSPDRASTDSGRELQGLVAAYGAVDAGALPRAGYGGGAALGIRVPLDDGPSPVRLRAEGTFTFFPARRTESADGAPSADVRLITGAARVGLVYGMLVEVGPSVGYEIGSLAGEGVGVKRANNGAALWQAALVGAGARWPARGPIGVRASAELVVPFARPEFELSDAAIHRPSALGGRGTVGADFSF